MKMLLVFITVANFYSSFAYSQVVECKTALMVSGWDETTHAPIYIKKELNLKVFKNSMGKYGYEATYVYNGNQVSELYTDFTIMVKPFDEEALEFIEFFFPLINHTKVQTIKFANIGVQANEEDANGINIVNIYDAKMNLVGSAGTIGWGQIKCLN